MIFDIIVDFPSSKAEIDSAERDGGFLRRCGSEEYFLHIGKFILFAFIVLVVTFQTCSKTISLLDDSMLPFVADSFFTRDDEDVVDENEYSPSISKR